jgi:membrane protein
MSDQPLAWPYALRRTIQVLLVERVADIAASLTFYGVLSVFPAMLAVFGLFGLAGEGRHTAHMLLSFADRTAPHEFVSPLRGTIQHLASVGGPGAGIGTAVALVVAVWTASRYVAGFSGALNRVYGVEEGRQFWKRRLVQLGITVAVLLLTALVLFVLLFSGPVFGPKGVVDHLGDVALAVWSVARWVLAVAAMLVVIVLLYWGTPNIRHPRLRWMTSGGVSALLLMALASAGFALYVTHFSSFHRQYGALAGLIVFLIWLWLMNVMLLFGAAFDVELERVRELRSGLNATRKIQLPLRDDRRIETLRHRDNELAASATRFLPTARP